MQPARGLDSPGFNSFYLINPQDNSTILIDAAVNKRLLEHYAGGDLSLVNTAIRMLVDKNIFLQVYEKEDNQLSPLPGTFAFTQETKDFAGKLDN